ncbi:citrinin biosynthesis oxidoreductase [Phlyctema vagabunda]|uniref:Citrinin biosynthesis oxidoreductase n=1 Tax=Phlyctema vagabunda TaxID=108571 RepID=A0ABR4P378_9HELO
MMALSNSKKKEDTTLHLPRILCLHGGGTNAIVFRMQCRVVTHHLRDSFRFVFVDAPFPCDPHPDIIPVYAGYGPYLRWLRSLTEHAAVDSETMISTIDESLGRAMNDDDLKGGTGQWVALMGFSQGAKIAASLLYRQQVRAEKLGKRNAGSDYRFAVLMAGSAPVISLDREVITNSPAIIDAAVSCEESWRWIDTDWLFDEEHEEQHMLHLPTIHVHGLQDPGLHMHQRLLTQYCRPENSKLMEWDGAHRIPIKTPDVMQLVDLILQTAVETGVLKSQVVRASGFPGLKLTSMQRGERMAGL